MAIVNIKYIYYKYLSTSEASKLEPGVITPPAPGVVARRGVGPGPPTPPVAVPDALSRGV